MVAVCEKPRPHQHHITSERALMLAASDVAALLNCSTKSVYRLNDRGAIPRPVRIGGMLRWHRGQLEQWLADGCPPRRGR